ncbi:MAG: hypothetical protein Q8O09_05260 [Bacillota bacterium]|nr:hypothetical protein [Bacillota bacterium]
MSEKTKDMENKEKTTSVPPEALEPDKSSETGEKKEATQSMVYRLRCKITLPDGSIEDGEAAATVDDEALHLLPNDGLRIDLPYRDISSAKAEDYRVFLDIASGGRIELYYLGKQYGFFVGDFIRKYDDTVKKDTFMAEEVKLAAKGAKFCVSGERNASGICNISIGSTAMILEAENGPIYRLPYALVENPRRGDYCITFSLFQMENWELSMLGKSMDDTWRDFTGAMDRLLQPVYAAVEGICPGVNPFALRKAAFMLRDGRAAKRDELEAAAPGLWEALIKQAEGWGAGEYFSHLLQRMKGEPGIGYKKPLRSDQEEYLFIIARVGNSLVLEAASPEGGGKATYVFSAGEDPEGLMGKLNYCLHMVEFRREPIYLSEAELAKPENASYAKAVQMMPQLKLLRAAFKGRVTHSTVDAWKAAVEKLL